MSLADCYAPSRIAIGARRFARHGARKRRARRVARVCAVEPHVSHLGPSGGCVRYKTALPCASARVRSARDSRLPAEQLRAPQRRRAGRWLAMMPTSLTPDEGALPAAVAAPLWVLVFGAVLSLRRGLLGVAPVRVGLGALCLLLFVHALVPIHGGHEALQLVVPPAHVRAGAPVMVTVRQIVQPVLSPLPQRPSPTPSPQPPPQSSPVPVTSVQSPVPITGGGFVPSQPDFELTSIPPLSECGGPLFRMQIVLLLELCFEILFLFLRCFAERDGDDDDTSTSGTTDTNASIQINMRAYILIRAIYTVPVLIINVSIYWIGGGPTGACLSNYPEVQVPFTHLLFYLFFCVIIIVMGLIRIDEWDPSTTSTSYRSRTFRSDGPPTRTTSYFRYTRPARRSRTSSTSYSEPKFRCNLGCCAINI